MKALKIFSLLVWVFLTSCGGGGGGSKATNETPGGITSSGGGYSISLDKSSLTFNVGLGVPSIAQTVNANFKGDGIVVGYPTNVSDPGWISVQTVSSDSTTATFSISTLGIATAGSFTTTLRFITGKSDGSNLKYVDIPVTVNVTKQFTVTNFDGLQFIATQDDTKSVSPNTGHSINISGDLPTWTISSDASWLKFSAKSGTGDSIVTVTADPTGLAVGTSTAKITILDSKSNRSFELTASFEIRKKFTVTSTGSVFEYYAVQNEPQTVLPASGFQLNIDGFMPFWTVSSDVNWLQISNPSGSGTGSVTLKANASGLASGVYSGKVTVFDSSSAKSFSFDTTIVVSQQNYALTVKTNTTPQDLIIPLIISDQHNGANSSDANNWALKSIDAPWLSLNKSSGTTLSSASPNFVIDATKIKDFANGSRNASVTLTLSGPSISTQDIVFNFNLLMSLPKINYVAPYIAIENKSGSGYLRGDGFDQTSALQVTIGNTQATSSSPDDYTQMRFNYPALAAGSYDVEIKNNLNIKRSSVALKVIAQSAFTGHSLDVPAHRKKLLFDNERKTLYAVNRVDQELERYQYTNGVWTTLSSFILANLRDVDISPDGKQLLVVNNTTVNEIELGAANFNSIQKAVLSDTFCGNHFDQVAFANDGKAVLSTNYSACSGSTYWQSYDLLSGMLGTNAVGWFYNGILAGSADGSRIYAGTNGLSPEQPVAFYNSLSGSFSNGSANYNLNAVTVGGNASKIILQDRYVYSSALILLGNVPQGKALVSRDSSKAYIYLDDGSQPRIEIYDLNGALQTGAVYPKVSTINLSNPILSQPGTYYEVSLAESADGKTLFVSGDLRILVVPLP